MSENAKKAIERLRQSIEKLPAEAAAAAVNRAADYAEGLADGMQIAATTHEV